MRSLIGAVVNRSPVPLAEAGSRARPTIFNTRSRVGDGFVAQMETYGSVGTVHAIVEKLTDAVSRVDWKLWRKADSGLPEDRVEVTSHAALDLWNRPNKFMSRQQLVQAFQQHKELTGEGNLVIGTAGGAKIPLELWPIRPDRLEPVPDPYEFLKGWVYTGPSGEKVPLELTELLRAISPSPLDPYRGSSAIASILTDLDSVRYQKEYQRNFYLNSAEPGGVIQVDRRLSDAEFDEMRDRWSEQHRGVSKAHRVAIIEMGAQWVDRKLTMKDQQFMEMTTAGRDIILEALGFPKFMLGIVEDVNRANAEASEYMFGKWLTEPRCEAIKGMLNTQLLPLYGERAVKTLEFDYCSPVPENAEQDMAALTARSNAAVALSGIPGMNVPSVLEAVGLPEMEYEEPPPPPTPSPAPGLPGQADAPGAPEDTPPPTASIEGAMRWVAEAHKDASTCEKCAANDGKTYRNRADAYKDYPDGKGYVDCVGAEFGNECRCKVVKRRRQS